MKKMLLIVIALSTINLSYAQVKKSQDVSKSNLEDFSETSGSLIKKEFTDVGKLRSVKIQLLKITNLATNISQSGLRIESQGVITHVAFLDADEIDAFLKTIDYITDNVLDTDPSGNYTEYNFISRGGFSAGAFNYSKKWVFYMKPEKFSSDSQIDFSKEDLIKIKEAVLQVKGLLK